MSNKEHICVYPNQCRFPNCNCDQPQKVKSYGFSGNGFYSRAPATPPEPGPYPKTTLIHGTDGKVYISTVGGISFVTPKAEHSVRPTPPSSGPTDIKSDVKSVDPNRPRFVVYIRTDHCTSPTQEQNFIDAARADLYKEYPHEKDAATWIFVGIREGMPRIERLS